MNPAIWMMMGYPKVPAIKGRHEKEKKKVFGGKTKLYFLVKRKCVSYLWFCFKIYLYGTIYFYFYFLVYVSINLGSSICLLEVMNIVRSFINTLDFLEKV